MRASTLASFRIHRELDARGFTLIELMLALGVMAVVLSAAVYGVGALTGSKAKQATAELSGVIRSLYDTSSLSGKTCRLVIKMPDARAQDQTTQYWAECAAGGVTARKDRDDELREERDRAEKAARDGKRDSGRKRYGAGDTSLQDMMNQEKERVASVAKFSSFTSAEISPRTFPSTVQVSVWTKHQTKPVKEGSAYLYFFPQGFTEKSMVFVRQGENVWTITVNPLTGKTKIVGEELEVPRT